MKSKRKSVFKILSPLIVIFYSILSQALEIKYPPLNERNNRPNFSRPYFKLNSSPHTVLGPETYIDHKKLAWGAPLEGILAERINSTNNIRINDNGLIDEKNPSPCTLTLTKENPDSKTFDSSKLPALYSDNRDNIHLVVDRKNDSGKFIKNRIHDLSDTRLFSLSYNGGKASFNEKECLDLQKRAKLKIKAGPPLENPESICSNKSTESIECNLPNKEDFEGLVNDKGTKVLPNFGSEYFLASNKKGYVVFNSQTGSLEEIGQTVFKNYSIRCVCKCDKLNCNDPAIDEELKPETQLKREAMFLQDQEQKLICIQKPTAYEKLESDIQKIFKHNMIENKLCGGNLINNKIKIKKGSPELTIKLEDLSKNTGHEVAAVRNEKGKIVGFLKYNKGGSPQTSRAEVYNSELYSTVLDDRSPKALNICNDKGEIQGALSFMVGKENERFVSTENIYNKDTCYIECPSKIEELKKLGKNIGGDLYEIKDNKICEDFAKDKTCSNLLNSLKDSSEATCLGMASLLAASYFFEEDDLHKGNFGLSISPTGEKRFVRIDLDMSTWSIIGKKVQSRTFLQQPELPSFEINEDALDKFPLVGEEKVGFYNPCYTRNFLSTLNSGEKKYSEEDTQICKDLVKNDSFNKDKIVAFMNIATEMDKYLNTNNHRFANNAGGAELESEMFKHYQERTRALTDTLKSYLNKLKNKSSEDLKSICCLGHGKNSALFQETCPSNLLCDTSKMTLKSCKTQ